MRSEIIQWLDAFGSCTASFEKDTGNLLVRGVPCRDFHHRGFDVVRAEGGFAAHDALGRELGSAPTMEEAVACGVEAVTGLKIASQPPPPLSAVSPPAASVCRDWSLRTACFDRPAPVRQERAEVLQAVMDAVSAGHLAALEAPVGAGLHHIVAHVALELLNNAPSAALRSARVLELDWLKLNAGQTASNALGPGEGLARALEHILAEGHVPVIPRGRVGELIRVITPDFHGIVLSTRPGECLALSMLTHVMRIPLPDVGDSLLEVAVTDEARKLEAEMGVEISDQTVQYALQNAPRCVEEGIGPLAFVEMPGAAVTLLRIACHRALVQAGEATDVTRRPVVTPADLALGLISLGVHQDIAMAPVLSSISPPKKSGAQTEEG